MIGGGSIRRKDLISDDLLDIARRLAEGNSTQTDLRRPVSSIYYAVFHAICQSNADTLVGDNPQDRDESAWRQAYRALEHGYARRRCRQVLRSGRFLPPVQRLADFVAVIQDLRHRADYDPDTSFVQQEVVALINEADNRITAFRAVPARERRAFAVYVLMRERQD